MEWHYSHLKVTEEKFHILRKERALYQQWAAQEGWFCLIGIDTKASGEENIVKTSR